MSNCQTSSDFQSPKAVRIINGSDFDPWTEIWAIFYPVIKWWQWPLKIHDLNTKLCLDFRFFVLFSKIWSGFWKTTAIW
jgi:hypothetical protein